MSTQNEQIAVSTDTAFRFVSIITEATKRLVQLQTDAMTLAFTENAKNLKGLLNPTDSATLLAEWPRFYQTNVQRIVEVTRSWVGVMSQTQAEMAQLMGQSIPGSKGLQQHVEQFTKAMNDGRDAALAGMKDALGKTGGDVVSHQAAQRQKVA